MKIYKAQKLGSLMAIKAYIKGPEAVAYPKMLIDTGAVVTIIAQEILESIGCSPASALKRKRIVTASGYEILPVVSVSELNCCGHLIKDYPVIAHTLPFGTYVNGLIGMDFLTQFEIDIKRF
jgi:predicted aspartyl protease